MQLIKGTSLAAIIGFTEITRAGQIINNATFQPFIVFGIVAAIYFVALLAAVAAGRAAWNAALLAAGALSARPTPDSAISTQGDTT